MGGFLKIRRFFAKLLSKMKKCSSSNGRYKDFTPEKKISNCDEYFEELEWALRNPNIRNIALAGPYGAGKSSIINSFFDKNIIYDPITISMASFKEKNKADDNGNQGTENCDQEKGRGNQTEEIARGFLQQLFYKVDYKRIPQSRYRKIHRIKVGNIMGILVFISIVCLLILCIVNNSSFSDILRTISEWGSNYGINKLFCSLISLIVYLILLLIVSFAIKWVFGHIGNAEISISKFAKVSTDKSNKETVFNKYLDEIVYFFEETKYDVVILEDIDRFDNTEIFVKLRELNRLLNSYDSIKRKIVFIYALKDDFFENSTDRTKFFDFIVSVIPFINSTNSENLFRRRIKEIRESNMEIEVADDYITKVAPFISDMRVLTSIFNDFILYKNTLNKDKELNLSDEQMLSLMIYKNTYPKDFAAIESEQGIIKECFNAKKKFIDEKATDLLSEVMDIKERLEDTPADPFCNIEDFKVALLYKLSQKKGTVSSIQIGRETISFSEIMAKDFDLKRLCNRPITVNVLAPNSRNALPVNDINDLIGDSNLMIKQWESLELQEKENRIKAQEEIERIKDEIYSLKALKIKDIIKKYGTSFISPDANFCDENKLLIFFLRNGYIDETYVNYINYFHPDSITRDELKFILGIRYFEGCQDFEQEIVHKQRVVDRLIVHEFRQIEVLNFSLVDYLLSSKKDDEKQNELLFLLSSRTEEVREFIRRFIQRYDEKADSFINKLSNESDYFWNDLKEDLSITDGTKIHYFDLLINYSDLHSIVRMNEKANRCVASFIEDIDDIFSKIKLTSTDKVVEIIHSLDFKIKKINCDEIDLKICELIFSEAKFEISDNNLSQFVHFRAPELSEKYNNAKHTTLLEIKDENVIKYLEDNLDEYLKSIILLEGNTQESINAILDICDKFDFDSKAMSIIDSQECIFNDIGVIVDEYDKELVLNFVEYLFEIEKCTCDWNNINIYYDTYGLTTFLFEIIQKKINKLAKMKDELDDSFIDELLYKEWEADSLRIFLRRYSQDVYSIDIASIPEDNAFILLEEDWIPFRVDIYNSISKLYPDKRLQYILNNSEDFFEVIKDISLEAIPIDEIMKEEKISEENKLILINMVPAEKVTREMAIFIRNTESLISKVYFKAAWDILELEEKYQLLLNHLEILDNSDLPSLFNELDYPYKSLADRTKHKITFYGNEYNEKLLVKLKKKRYVSSTGVGYKEKTKVKPILHKEKEKYVYAWVRAIAKSVGVN